ncbi:hypothetical protein KUCAC02_022203 [Chaenocephalus aceratus]|nr:hypothetical protein KUCAC02_022203 [Chaenocephalus aceratus]
MQRLLSDGGKEKEGMKGTRKAGEDARRGGRSKSVLATDAEGEAEEEEAEEEEAEEEEAEEEEGEGNPKMKAPPLHTC